MPRISKTSRERQAATPRSRKPRADAGKAKPSVRDLNGLRFVAEQTYATFEQIGQWLAPHCAPAINVPAEELPTFAHGGNRKVDWPLGRKRRQRAVAQLVARWEHVHHLVETSAEVAGWPTWVRATPLALQKLGYDWKDTPFPVQWEYLAPGCHYEHINRTRLLLARQALQVPKHRWVPERQLLSEQEKAEPGIRRPHRPDGYLYLHEDGAYPLMRQQQIVDRILLSKGQRIAIEVERSRKDNARLNFILSDLLAHYDFAWYFCLSERVYQALIAARRDGLTSDEERRRIRILMLEND